MKDESIWRWVSHAFTSDGDLCELCGVDGERAIHSRSSARKGEPFIENTRDDSGQPRTDLTDDELEAIEADCNRFVPPIPGFAEAVRFAIEKGRVRVNETQASLGGAQ